MLKHSLGLILLFPTFLSLCDPSGEPTDTPVPDTPTPTASEGPSPTPGPDLGGELLVSSYFTDTITRVQADGTSQGNLGSVPGAQSVVEAPDGRLIAVAEKEARVLTFDGTTGAFLGDLVADDPDTPEDETGGLANPTSAIFAGDGSLLVGSFSNNNVLRYDGESGVYLGVFIDAGEGELSGPDAGMIIGPDGDLYVPSYNNHRILRFDGDTGAFEGTVVDRMGGIRNPRTLAFDSQGRLWVTSWGAGQVRRYQADGTLVDIPISMTGPTGLTLREDIGEVWVASDQTDVVERYDFETGEALGTLARGEDLGIGGLTFLYWLD